MEMLLWVVLLVALALAIGMAGVAWRLLRSDRRRTEARVTMLRHLAVEPETPPPPDIVFRTERAPEIEPQWQDAAIPPEVFATVSRTPAHSRRWMPVIVVTLFVALGAGTVYGLYGPAAEGGPLVPPFAGLPWRAAEPRPLELLSLSHQVDAGDFVVTGLVQNPPAGRPAPDVMAVVYVFNAKGEYFASGKAALEFAPLAPGAESPFVVRLPKTSGVSRFRVGFRAEDGSVVAHVDRRGQPIEGTTAGGMRVPGDN